MALYKLDDKKLTPIFSNFRQQKIRERKDLQPLFKSNPEILSPGILIVAEEFCGWTDSRLRIDLLGVDKSANFVVFELKSTEDGGHAELQAIRYAAMTSTITFDDLVRIYDQYLVDNGFDDKRDAKSDLLEFLGWEESDDVNFGQRTRIILVSAGFSKELTTSVLWLNEQGLDIQCLRMIPYESEGQVLLDIQAIIPLPGTEEYQIRVRQKKYAERKSRESARDLTKYDLIIDGKSMGTNLNKRKMVWRLISEIIKRGVDPERVGKVISPSKFRIFKGKLDAGQVEERFEDDDAGGKVRLCDRFFCKEGELFYTGEGKTTYVLSNQWGTDAIPAVKNIKGKFPELKIEFKPSDLE